ncbi:site-specific integrase [Mucilaginibacter defluvii]|uniref:Site-specific integrase n=1 Tax=Mucilaginibacter defluvii TaxID=1196019 RepID=A0ABP9FS79_9SPHI
MKIKQNLSLLVWLNRSKGNQFKAPIYIRITIDSKEVETSLSQSVEPSLWDSENKRVIGKSPMVKEINQQIEVALVALKSHFAALQLQYDLVTPEMVKRAYKGKPPVETEQVKLEAKQCKVTLIEEVDQFNAKFLQQVNKGTRSFETYKHWVSTKNKLVAFLKYKYGKENILISQVTTTFADDFYFFMTVADEKTIGEAAAKKHVKNTKQIIKESVKKQLLSQHPFSDFRCGGDETDIPPLEWEQVLKIYHKNLPVQRLSEVRDVFIFQCFTGFAFQDVYGLTSEHIVTVGRKGERWLIKKRGKTDVTEMVPILPIVEKLIAKYQVHPYCKAQGALLPVNTNQRYNSYLKELSVLCGINRNLNTHLARHTFADIMLNAGVPLEDVSKMLGHKSIRTTQRYGKIRKERISVAMSQAKIALFTKSGDIRKTA